MNFQDLKKVETSSTYLDIAIKRGKRKRTATKPKDSINRIKDNEMRWLQAFDGNLTSRLIEILEGFPSFRKLPKFYLELVKVTIDYLELKKSLAAVKWAVDKIKLLTKIYCSKVSKAQEPVEPHNLKKQYLGRVASVLKQIDPQLAYLERCRKIMKGYPTIKTSMFTVAIAGFPNVGKTTLLSRLTGSTPEIRDYAFTTKGINVGYMREEAIQLLDTPGTLNRPDRMNPIEKQAYLAMEHCAQAFIYIFDLTEPYPLQDQVELYQRLVKEGREIIIYLSKADILPAETISGFSYGNALDIDGLRKELVKLRNQISP